MESSRKSSGGGWNSAIFIIFVEFAERFAYNGVVGNLITYMTDDLGKSTADAAKSVNTWVGVASVCPLGGALVADSYLGRFTTILVASAIYLTGMIVLALAVSVVPRQYREAVFFTALYIVAVGEGGHKPCVQTFVADQFKEDTPDEKAAKSSFFNWWYLGNVLGATTAVLVAVYVQDQVGWTCGFGILAAALGVSVAIFVVGIRRYTISTPVGSPMTRLLQVLVAAARKLRVDETRDTFGIYHEDEDENNKFSNLGRTSTMRWLDKAMMKDKDDVKKKNRWRVCSQRQVEEAKLVLRLLPIGMCCVIFALIQTQLNTYFTKQANTLQRRIGRTFTLPPASLQGFVGFTLLLAVPFYDRLFVPFFRSITGRPSGITILQRIGIGLFLSTFTMVAAGMVETKRIQVAKMYGLIDSPKSTIPMSFWWLFPQYMLCGISDVFTIVGLQELFYDKMPESMRSMGAALYVVIVGAGSFASTAFISLAQAISARFGQQWLVNNLNRAHLNYYYWVVAGFAVLNLCVYLWIASGFEYKVVEEVRGGRRKDMGSKGEENGDSGDRP